MQNLCSSLTHVMSRCSAKWWWSVWVCECVHVFCCFVGNIIHICDNNLHREVEEITDKINIQSTREKKKRRKKSRHTVVVFMLLLLGRFNELNMLLSKVHRFTHIAFNSLNERTNHAATKTHEQLEQQKFKRIYCFIADHWHISSIQVQVEIQTHKNIQTPHSGKNSFVSICITP